MRWLLVRWAVTWFESRTWLKDLPLHMCCIISKQDCPKPSLAVARSCELLLSHFFPESQSSLSQVIDWGVHLFKVTNAEYSAISKKNVRSRRQNDAKSAIKQSYAVRSVITAMNAWRTYPKTAHSKRTLRNLCCKLTERNRFSAQRESRGTAESKKGQLYSFACVQIELSYALYVFSEKTTNLS